MLLPQAQPYRDVQTSRMPVPRVNGAAPVAAPPAVEPEPDGGPVPIPLVTLTHLRGLRRGYDDAIDVLCQLLGYPQGGCAVDLTAGVVYPPGSWPLPAATT